MKKLQLFHKGFGFQTSPLNDLQKAFAAPGLPDGDKAYEVITVIDETIRKGDPGHEFVVFMNKADTRQALLEAMQRGDPAVKPNDAALIDNGRIRKGLAERLYPGHSWDRGDDGAERTEDGSRMVKGGEGVLRDAYGNYAKSPGVDLRAAAAELDALVEQFRR